MNNSNTNNTSEFDLIVRALEESYSERNKLRFLIENLTINFEDSISSDNSSEEIAGLIFDNLKEKVEEAKDTRNNTVDWIKKTSKQLKELPLSGSSVKVIHNAWKEMENRSQEMLLTDLHYMANLLDSLLKKHYRPANTRGAKFTSPFVPPNTDYKTQR